MLNPIQQLNITTVEWFLIFSVAILGDFFGPIGFIAMPIILLWYKMRIGQVPLERFLLFTGGEIISLGILPGWTGLILIAYLEQKGYLKTLTRVAKLIKAKK